MSFSSQVKKELAEHVSSSRHCRLAELGALYTLSGREHDNEHSMTGDKIKKLTKLLQLAYGSDEFELALKIIHRDDYMIVDRMLIERSCCKQSYLRGAFLANGSVTDPSKGYHFEIVSDYEEQAQLIMDIMRGYGLEPKRIQRKKYHVVYMKDGSMIVDVLNVMGAHVSLMNMENVRILKDMRNKVNRRVNCETANINKTVSAAVRQIEDIQYIEQTKGLEYLPEQLRVIAIARKEEPDAPLKELGESLTPPLGKSGVNHRLRKISEIADELRRS